MGLNFSIVLGAMAAQAVMIFVTHWGVTGLPGILLCMVLVTPLSVILGYITGRLFNKTKGQEMITGLILGFFAQGVYKLIFLQLIGGVIPMNNPALVMSSGVGIRTTVDLSRGLKYGLDQPGAGWNRPNLLRPTLPWTAVAVAVFGLAAYLIYSRRKGVRLSKPKLVLMVIGYGSHEQVGLYSVAAILVGGATVAKAGIGHALLGVLLFHTLFIVSPAAGRRLFGDAQVGEYFRVFVAYSVIGVTLALHAWKHLLQAKNKRETATPEEAG